MADIALHAPLSSFMSDITSLPGDIFTTTFQAPTGSEVGYQIRRASNDTVVTGRTEVGVAERPAGLGTFVVEGNAPIEEGVYLVVADWNGGVLADGLASVKEMMVSSSVAAETTGLGAIADEARAQIGITFDKLRDSANYGEPTIVSAVETVKARVMVSPPSTADEALLAKVVRNYLGKLAALELMTAATDYWAAQYQSEATGNDPTETATYPDRLKALSDIEERLLKAVQKDQAAVAVLLTGNQILRSASDGPAIDEVDDCRVTSDPRRHPHMRTYADDDRHHHHLGLFR